MSSNTTTRAKIVNRVVIAGWLIYLPVAELGATGSYQRMAGVFAVLVLTAWLGWMERDNTKSSADGNGSDQ